MLFLAILPLVLLRPLSKTTLEARFELADPRYAGDVIPPHWPKPTTSLLFSLVSYQEHALFIRAYIILGLSKNPEQ